MDLNCDMGEGFGAWSMGDDDAMLDLVTSANIACGFHAGDPSVMRRVCASAAQRDVRIGAHVAYRDLAGFGRRAMVVPPEQLRAEVLYQIGALDGIARAAGSRVSYVKPHGALYNTAAVQEKEATAVVEALGDYDRSLILLCPPDSWLAKASARAGIASVAEAFADRAYNADGTLVARGQPGAVLHDPQAVAERAVRMVRTGSVDAIDGATVALAPDSLCVHGDTPTAVELARAIRARAAAEGIEFRSFVDGT